MTLHPAPPNAGVVFCRTDLGGVIVPADHDHVRTTALCTGLGNEGGAAVSTTEHVLAALAGLGVDNAVIELDGPEVPIMDGSAAPFVFLVECAGLVEQEVPRRAIQVLKTVEISHGHRRVSLSPSDRYSMSCEIAYDHPAIGCQACYVELTEASFKRDISHARTFGFLRDVASLRERGLILGGSLDNAVVLSDDGILNEDGLRYADEFVRHKMLDGIGDFYLAGAHLLAHVQAVCSGHRLNHELLAALFGDSGAWRCITLDEAGLASAVRWQDRAVAASA